MTRSTGSPFEAVVFAGGGNRCLWQAGFVDTVTPELGLAPRMVSGSSAGATMACLLAAGRTRATLALFKEATARNRRNVYPLNALAGRPVFPHLAMYRRAIVEGMGPEGLSRLRSGPDVRVQLTRLPRWLGPRLGAALGMAAYSVEKALSNPVHPRLGARVGFRAEVRSARECADLESLADLLLASSCTPPFTPVLRIGGAPVLDGGVVENVPVQAVADATGPVLVLLTRPYAARSLPAAAGRTYVQPSRPLRVSKFDYTDPQGLQEAYDLGCEDAEAFLRRREAEAAG